MQHISVLIKPASSACNMKCAYCFYEDVANSREQEFQGFLREEQMEQVIVEAMKLAERSCSFLFQGGEPTLAGLSFYESVIRLQKKHRKDGVLIYNSIQTNGYRLTEDMICFFVRERFLIGVSLDGPEQVHDLYRTGRSGGGTFREVMETIALLKRFRADYNVLCVVTEESAKKGREIYRFYREQGFGWMQFIPCLAPLDGAPEGGGYAPSPTTYGRFLTEVFDCWLGDLKRGEFVSIRHLDNWMAILLGGQPACCGMVGRCSIQFVVEGDGGVYPCDFYVLDEWRMGTVGEQSFESMCEGTAAREFLEESAKLPEDCRTCRFYVLCRNGCRRERSAGKNIYCESYRMFFSDREKELEQAAHLIKKKMIENYKNRD